MVKFKAIVNSLHKHIYTRTHKTMTRIIIAIKLVSQAMGKAKKKKKNSNI